MEPITPVNNGNNSCFYTGAYWSLQHDPQDVHYVDLPPLCYTQNTPHLSLFPVDNCDPNIYTTIKSTVWTTEIPKAVQLNADNDNDIVH